METLGIPKETKLQKKDTIISSEFRKRVSEQDYWEHYYEHPDLSYEWNNGLLEEKPMPDYLSFQMYRWFLQLLEEYLKTFPVGRLMGLEMGFRLDMGKKQSIRKPDLALILHTNPVATHDLDRSFRGVCDLCIEFLSDSTKQELERDTVTKKTEYEAVGVREYYIVDRLKKHNAFYQLTPQGVYQSMDTEKNGVIRSQVLKGFAFRLQDLEATTEFETLIEDSLYQSFLLKSFQQERQEKEQALQEKEQERQKKEQALAEIERLQSLLKNQ